MNTVFYAVLTTLAAAEAGAYTVMDYVKVLGGIFITGLVIYKIGDIKMILYVVATGVVIVAAVLLIPQLQGTQIQAIVLDFVNGIPGLISDLLGGTGL